MLVHVDPPTEQRPWPDMTLVLDPGDHLPTRGLHGPGPTGRQHHDASRIFKIRPEGLEAAKSRRYEIKGTFPWADVEEALAIKDLMDKNGWDRQRLAAVIAAFARGERLG